MTTELSQLKQEVAELWTRYRQHQPPALFGEDEERRGLAEQNRTLEGKRRALSERSSTLRLELEAHRRKAARLSPVARVVGGFIGIVTATAGSSVVLPDLAALSVGLSAAHGAIALAVSLFVLGLCVGRVER